jgi:hypothetical protein
MRKQDTILRMLLGGRALSAYDAWRECHTNRLAEYIRRIREDVAALTGRDRDAVVLSVWEQDGDVRYVRYEMPDDVRQQLYHLRNYLPALWLSSHHIHP